MPSPEDRWRQLETLFTTASDLPVEARAAFVDTHTADDPDLRRDLAGMLAHASDGGALIARAIGAGAVTFPAASRVGRYVGPYRIIREIGRGGMGLVFEAVRDDDEYRKTVALKIAPLWIDATSVRERFRLERQILAGLEHPSIARLLDGGTEDGVPYFVMEYVDGLPITEFCDTHSLDVRARLALVRQVCAAVHFAHESLVVHRDLKPSNILVPDDGTPKLLDFGIAKLLDPFADGTATATIEARWTPNYTSPEQVRGRAVTTRTDVYFARPRAVRAIDGRTRASG
jgi:serine/threonine protein kinase